MAVLLTWALFAVWAVVGLAALKLGRHRWTVRTLLLAPAVGFATVAVPIYILVRFGLSVGQTGVPVGAALLAGAAWMLWRARPRAALARRLWKRSRAFGLVLAGAFGLVGWPLFQYGFGWVASGNDDMANYCLIATGYRDHGFARVPTSGELTGDDPTQAFWSTFIVLQIRPGSEILLATASAWTGLSAQQVFMPTLVALHLALVAAACGLAAGVNRRAGVLTGALLAASAASTYGIVWQLIGQVSGLALLCASLALVSGRFRRIPGPVLLARAGACGVAFTGLLVFYPEVIPILVGACVLLGVRELLRGRLDRRHLAHAGGAIAVMAALLPVYLFGAASFLANQAQQGAGSSGDLFPYLLTPRAPAIVCGLLTLVQAESERLQNVCIGLGAVLVLGLAVPVVRGVMRSNPAAAALATGAALTAMLYVNQAGFGLFKIAMFVQPFLWAVVAGWVVARRGLSARFGAVVLCAVVAGLNARAQFWYVDQSRGLEVRVELPAVTPRDGLAQFRADYARRAADRSFDRVLVATENNVLAKLLAVEVRGVPFRALGVDPFEALVENGFLHIEGSAWARLNRGRMPAVLALRDQFEAAREQHRPVVTDPDTGQPLYPLTHLPAARGPRPERVLVLGGGGPVSVLNRHQFPEDGPVVVCAPLSEVRDFAVMCDAGGARQHFFGLGDPSTVALYQLEADATFRGRTMAASGRALVLDVLNPSPQVRVLVAHTSSFKADPAQRGVAPVQLIGARRVSLGTAGLGAARLVAPPVTAQPVGTGHYLVLEFGDPAPNPNRLTAVEQLWGANLLRDRRQYTGHLREVSVLSEEEYAAFRPPVELARFPDDLLHPHAEYSGFSEEGWVAKEFKVRLTQPRSDDEVVLKGFIPDAPGTGANFRTELTVLVDGKAVETRALGVGEFEARVPGGAAPGPRWVECRFSHDLLLPAPDGRRAVAHVRSIGFEPRDEAKSRTPERLAAFPTDLSHPKLEQSGVFVDGWTAPTFRARLSAAPGNEVVVRGTVPGFTAPEFRTNVTVLLDGTAVAEREVGNGDFEIRAPTGASSVPAPRWIEVRVSRPQTLPAPDGRSIGVQLKSLGFEPAK